MPDTLPRPRFTLYTRSYCHLCQDMLDALQALAPPNRPFDVHMIDIDTSADPDLLVRYDTLVPVLFGDLALPSLCHYLLDREKVLAELARQAGPAGAPDC